MEEREIGDLKKRTVELEQTVQIQQYMLEIIWEFSRSVAEKEGLSLLSYQQIYSPSADSNKKVRMLLKQIGEL